MSKKCGTCGETKPDAEFYKRVASKDGLQASCKTCQRRHIKEWYDENRDACKERVARRAKRIHGRNREFILAHFERAGGCADCGEKDPVVLEFDHVRGKKVNNISTMVFARAMPFDSRVVQDELAKCEVVCANCHRRRTSKKLGYWYEDIGA